MTKQPLSAHCYYVQDPIHGWWAWFTITPEVGLLQIHSDFGMWAHRWDQPGMGFREFLLSAGAPYVMDKLEWWQRFTEDPSNQKQTKSLLRRLNLLMAHLWPIFREQLAASPEWKPPTRGNDNEGEG